MHLNSVWPKRIVSFVVAALLLYFVGYQIYNANFSRQQTETALYRTVEEKLQVTGYAVRDEQYLTNTLGGVLEYDLPDGSKINKGGAVAHAYESVADADLLHEAEDLQAQLSDLQEISGMGDSITYSTENVESLLETQLLTLSQLSEEPGADLDDARRELLKLLNEKQLADGDVQDFSERIAALQDQLSSLSVQSNGESLGAISAPEAGYFSSKTDGYENAFSYEDVLEIYAEDLDKDIESQAVPDNVIGRVCSQFNWYFVFTVSQNDASKFKTDTSVTISFPFASNEEVSATVARVNQRPGEDKAVIILESAQMDSALINLRKETAEVTLATYSGIQVSQDAVHFETVQKQVTDANGNTVTQEKYVEGVYVTYGTELQFRQIVPLYSDGNYIYCDPDPDLDTLMTDESIQLYDEVVIEGDDLYDGKVIE